MSYQELASSIREWSLQVSPCFVVGPERSGTSMLFNELAAARGFLDLPIATPETFVFLNVFLLARQKDHRQYPLKVYLGGDENFRKLQSYLRSSFPGTFQILEEISEKDWQRKSGELWHERGLSQFVRSFFYFSQQYVGNARIIEKTPAHIRVPERMHQAFPQASVIGIFRTPVHSFASLKKRLEKEVSLGKNANDPSLGWLKITAREYVRYIRSLDDARQRWESSEMRFLAINYEEFTRAHDREGKRVETFLGLDVVGGADTSTSAGDVPWDPLLGGKIVPNDVDVERFVSVAEQKVIESGLAELPWPWHPRA